MKIRVSTPINETPRLTQMRGIFDLSQTAEAANEWDVNIPLTHRPWNVGLVVGPSGSGKTTVAKHLWPANVATQQNHNWPNNKCILDAFPPEMGIKEITEILSSVGFSSPPSWTRPYQVLSTGEQFRATIARLIAVAATYPETHEQIVYDEYTSVVDRTVAKVGSAALARTIRSKNLKFIAITCHDDVEEWLNPDWTYRPAVNEFTWRSLRRRPEIPLDIFRCEAKAWRLFAPHHYLSGELHMTATCFMATWNTRPVAFSAWIPFYGTGSPTRREHRTVCLPDYQGVGIGNALSNTIAAMWAGLKERATSTTTHPSMIQSRLRSTVWRMVRTQGMVATKDRIYNNNTRLTAGFVYTGPAMPALQAKALKA
jgi:energy-coupling factor transporter ATP-binding protein EcfA2